jgi:transcriptional regulator with XRE-family HTH domain
VNISIKIRIREVRLSKGISLRKLEELSGISNGHISQIERGIKIPSLYVLCAIAVALNCEQMNYIRIALYSKHDIIIMKLTVEKTERMFCNSYIAILERACTEGVHMMDEDQYKELIIKMIEKTNSKTILKKIYLFVVSIIG